MNIPGIEPAYVFEDRQSPGDWHVQWTDDDGGFEMAIFSGPRAHNGRSCSPSGAMAATKKCALTRGSGGLVIGSEAEEPRTTLIGYEHPQIPAG